jgi:hypothetical protein
MVQDRDYEDKCHDDTLGITDYIVIDISDEEEETDEADFEEVDSCECLVDGRGKPESTAVNVAGADDVDEIILDDDPEEGEGYEDEGED